MRHERLAYLMQAHQETLRAHPEDRTPHETILSLFRGLDSYRQRLLAAGVPMGPNVLITVRGRKSRLPRTAPHHISF